MKATGIVRRIDELGRIVIPKELRRTFRIKEGTALEIFSGDNGELILKKFSPILELSDFASDVAESIYDILNCLVLVVDNDSVVAVSGANKKMFIKNATTFQIEKILEERAVVLKSGKDVVNVCDACQNEFLSQIICPIISNGDVVGGIIAQSKQNNLSNNDIKVIKTMSNYIEKQIS